MGLGKEDVKWILSYSTQFLILEIVLPCIPPFHLSDVFNLFSFADKIFLAT